jgi:hypothetical protein
MAHSPSSLFGVKVNGDQFFIQNGKLLPLAMALRSFTNQFRQRIYAIRANLYPSREFSKPYIHLLEFAGMSANLNLT